MTAFALYVVAKVLGLPFPVYDLILLFVIYEFMSWYLGEPVLPFLREGER